MAYFKINRNADSASQVLNTKNSLIAALTQAEQMLDESNNMTEAQAQVQYGIPVELPFATWKSTLQAVVDALDAVAITNYTSQLG